ncbi:MAG: hypothetical protein J7L61_03110 [Thermoplasmata archaeon]|nr:hypothetical protein [Thermoplasmata archaeon]
MARTGENGLSGEGRKENGGSAGDGDTGPQSKWIGIRLSRVMMEQVKEIVETHPEWAWRNPNDFVRDAVRRHMEYVRNQDRYNRRRVSSLPGKVDRIAEAVLDEKVYDEFRRKLSNILSSVDSGREPELFLRTVKDLLAEYVGEDLSARLIANLYEEQGGEDNGRKEG